MRGACNRDGFGDLERPREPAAALPDLSFLRPSLDPLDFVADMQGFSVFVGTASGIMPEEQPKTVEPLLSRPIADSGQRADQTAFAA